MFLKESRVPKMGELPLLNRDEFLGGVLDFTGELNRYAVAKATARDKEAVQKCRDVIDSLMGVFLEVCFCDVEAIMHTSLVTRTTSTPTAWQCQDEQALSINK